MRAFFFHLLALGLGSSVAYGLAPDRALTQYLHRIWQAQQGLPQGTIYSIAQTTDGYLWLGTQTGLVRFDGVRFSEAPRWNGVALEGAWLRDLLQDDAGSFWIATNDNGLFRLRNDELQKYSVENGLPSSGVRCVFPDGKNSLWICTTNGLARIENGKVVRVQQPNRPPNSLRAGCRGIHGDVWLGGEGPELTVLRGGRFEPYRLRTMSPFAFVRRILCTQDGDVWVGTSDGLIQLHEGQEKHYSTVNGLPDDRVFSLMQSRDGSIWIGTDDGFARLRNGEFESFRSRDGLSQSAVYSLYEDREGGIWAGTKNGLNQFLEGRSIPYTTSEGLPSNDAGPVIEDRQGALWAGTLDAGLARFDGRRFTVLTRQQGLASNTVQALAEGKDGALWVGTAKGLHRLRNGKTEAIYTTAQGLPSSNVHSLFQGRSALWIGTSAGLAAFQDGRLIRPNGLSPNWAESVRALIELQDGRLFVATENGEVDVYENGGLHEFHAPSATARDSVVREVDAFFEDAQNNLWIGMLGGGLRLLRNGQLFSFYLRDGLFDNEIYGITLDSQDRLWMACSKGIFTVPRADLLKHAAGEIRTFESRPYIPMDGLRTIECKPGIQPLLSSRVENRLWFSTTRGLLALDLSKALRLRPPPPVVVEDILVNGQREAASDIEKLPANDRKNLEFHYTGLSFVVPARITFRYMLEGFDKGWIEAGTRREAFYTNLPPGSYVFRVTGCNIDGTCNASGAAAAFVLAPRFYQHRWFIPLCIVLAAMSGWIAFRLRIRRLRAQFDLVLAERSRIARELHDTLIQGFSGITMAMQALSARLSKPEERESLLDIVQDAGACLKEARRSVAGLRNVPGRGSGLSAAIATAARQITETKDVHLKLKLEPDPQGLPADVEYNLLRIAQEAVSNSVKHSGARSIEVALTSTPRSLRLSVKDDGTGFTAHPRNTPPPGHYGLVGMKERASQIGARFDLASEPGHGTTIEVELPAKDKLA